MRRMFIGCLLILGIVTVGCNTIKSTTKPANDLTRLSKMEIAAYNANPENIDKIVCKREKPVGSLIPITVCYKVSKIKDRQLHDQQVLQEIQRNAPPLSTD